MLSVSCHPDGTAFATGSSDSKVKLWDLTTRTCAQTVADHTDQVRVDVDGCACERACVYVARVREGVGVGRMGMGAWRWGKPWADWAVIHAGL